MSGLDELERGLERLTRGEPAPGLWRKALETERGEPASARKALGPRLAKLLVPSKLELAVATVAMIGIVALAIGVFTPALGRARAGRPMVAARVPAEALRGIALREGYLSRSGGSVEPAAPSAASLRAQSNADAQVTAQTPQPESELAERLAVGNERLGPTETVRQVVRRATLELETADVAAAFAKAAHAISEARGEYVQDSSITGEGKEAQATLTLRVAADRLSAVLNELRQFGKVRAETTTGEDVTAQMVDLDARLRNERRVEAELLELMEKRADAPLKEVLELRDSIARVRQEIEQMTAQQQRLSRLVSLATVLVIIRTGDQPDQARAGLGEYFLENIRDAWRSGLAVLADTVGVILRVLVGGIIWWVLLAFGIALVVRWRRRRLAAGV
jgi:hypothetical protein